MFLVCTVTFILTALIKNHGDMHAYTEAFTHREFVISFILLAVFSSVIAHMLVNYGFAYLPVLTMSTFAMLQTVIAIISGVLLLHEPLTASIIIGSGLVLMGIYMVNRS